MKYHASHHLADGTALQSTGLTLAAAINTALERGREWHRAHPGDCTGVSYREDGKTVHLDLYPVKTVVIPACEEHQGYMSVSVRLYWICPRCKEPRGPVCKGRSYDGFRILAVDRWTNPCGHVDKYHNLLFEAANNGLNRKGIS